MGMNLNAINKANELYELACGKDHLINPISKTDSNIVRELRELFKKLKCTGVTAILDDYKYLKDEEVELALLDYNTNFKELEKPKQKDEEDNPLGKLFVRDFIVFEECTLELFYIKDFSKDEIWDYTGDGRMLYYIIINKGGSEDTKKPMFSNKRFLFYSREERDKKYDLLQQYFENNPKINLIK